MLMPPQPEKREDKRNLAKALSGFANSDGGLLVWGVEAKPDEDGVDAASRLVPIDRAEMILSQFQSLTGELVSPVVDGVEHRVIDGGGFLISHIPASDGGPHMARGNEFRCYYKRSGSSFYPMEHFDIADMFGRRRRPDLHLVAQQSPAFQQPRPIWVDLSLENRGRGLARFPFIEIELPDRFGGSNGIHAVGGFKLTRQAYAANRFSTFVSDADVAIHPGTSRLVLFGELPTHVHQPLGELTIRYRVAADGMALREASCLFRSK